MKLLLFTMIFFFTIGCFGQTTDNSGFGLLPPTDKELSGARISESPSNVNFALAVDLSNDLPAVGDQGKQNSCVAWALAYYLKSYYVKREKGWEYNVPVNDFKKKVFSPGFIYNSVRSGNAVCVGGMTFDQALKFLQQTGVTSWEDFPYNKDEDDCSFSGAIRLKPKTNVSTIAGFDTFDPSDILIIKKEINARRPVLIGIQVKNHFVENGYNTVFRNGKNEKYIWSPQYPLEIKDKPLHAVLCVGYDDSSKLLKFVNSYGPDWGSKGYFYIPYSRYKNAVFIGYTVSNSRDEKTPQFVNIPNLTPNPALGTTADLTYQDSIIISEPKHMQKLNIYLTYINDAKTTIVVQFKDFKKDSILQNILFQIDDKKSFFYENEKITFHFLGTTDTDRKYPTGEPIAFVKFNLLISKKEEINFIDKILKMSN